LVAAAAAVVVVAAFFAGAFLVGEAELFRLVPVDDFGLLDELAFFVFVPPVFLLPLGVFDRLRGLVVDDFFVVVVDFFFLPADEAFFGFVGADEFNLKLPLAPTPLVCFNDLFFVPARNADLRC